MGIQGLIPFLKNSSRHATLSEFSGNTAAIDAYCWLHKGAFSCAEKLVKGEKTDGYIYYVMKQINLLLSYNIKPILVFDGCRLPAKEITESKRRENRNKNRQKAKEFLRLGKVKEARECFQRCVDVTPDMAHQVILACRERNIDVIVAPYEADAQLAFLNKSKIADFVITEDSDLIIFGCDKILFKMDSNGGGCLIEQEKLFLSLRMPQDKFDFKKFREMCVLSGCDYLASLHGIGLVKACKFFKITSEQDVFKALARLPSNLKMPQLKVTLEYKEGFLKAIEALKYQLVFDPITRKIRPLIDYPSGVCQSNLHHCGALMSDSKALQLALGNIDVQTGEVVDSYDPQYPLQKMNNSKSSTWSKDSTAASTLPSIWDENYVQKITKVKEDIAASIARKEKERLAKNRKKELVVHIKRKMSDEVTDENMTELYNVRKKAKIECDNEAPSFKVSNTLHVQNGVTNTAIVQNEVTYKAIVQNDVINKSRDQKDVTNLSREGKGMCSMNVSNFCLDEEENLTPDFNFDIDCDSSTCEESEVTAITDNSTDDFNYCDKVAANSGRVTATTVNSLISCKNDQNENVNEINEKVQNLNDKLKIVENDQESIMSKAKESCLTPTKKVLSNNPFSVKNDRSENKTSKAQNNTSSFSALKHFNSLSKHKTVLSKYFRQSPKDELKTPKSESNSLKNSLEADMFTNTSKAEDISKKENDFSYENVAQSQINSPTFKTKKHRVKSSFSIDRIFNEPNTDSEPKTNSINELHKSGNLFPANSQKNATNSDDKLQSCSKNGELFASFNSRDKSFTSNSSFCARSRSNVGMKKQGSFSWGNKSLTEMFGFKSNNSNLNKGSKKSQENDDTNCSKLNLKIEMSSPNLKTTSREFMELSVNTPPLTQSSFSTEFSLFSMKEKNEGERSGTKDEDHFKNAENSFNSTEHRNSSTPRHLTQNVDSYGKDTVKESVSYDILTPPFDDQVLLLDFKNLNEEQTISNSSHKSLSTNILPSKTFQKSSVNLNNSRNLTAVTTNVTLTPKSSKSMCRVSGLKRTSGSRQLNLKEMFGYKGKRG